MPKRASVLLSYTRQLNVQSDVGAFVQSNGLKALGAAVDKACLTRSGIFGEPLGLLNMPGTSQVTFSTSATWANMLSYVANSEAANVQTSDISFIGAVNVKQKLMSIQKFLGQLDRALGHGLDDCRAARTRDQKYFRWRLQPGAMSV